MMMDTRAAEELSVRKAPSTLAKHNALEMRAATHSERQHLIRRHTQPNRLLNCQWMANNNAHNNYNNDQNISFQ